MPNIPKCAYVFITSKQAPSTHPYINRKKLHYCSYLQIYKHPIYKLLRFKLHIFRHINFPFLWIENLYYCKKILIQLRFTGLYTCFSSTVKVKLVDEWSHRNKNLLQTDFSEHWIHSTVTICYAAMLFASCGIFCKILFSCLRFFHAKMLICRSEIHFVYNISTNV